MNRSLLFTRLDYITVKPYLTLNNLYIMIIIVVLSTILTRSPYMLSAMLMTFGSVCATYPFAAGNKSGIDTFYSIIPLKKQNVIAGRYIFSLSFNMAICTVAFIISVVLSFIFNISLNIMQLLIILLCLYAFSTILISLQFPIFFKLGYTKAKLLASFPIILLSSATWVIQIIGEERLMNFINTSFAWINNNLVLWIVIVLAILTGMILVSMLLSYMFYRKKEF